MTEVAMKDLQHIGSAELQWEPWSFYVVDAWQGPDGIYIGTDSGCSCPSPFDWLRTPDQLTGPLTPEQAVEEITSLSITASDERGTRSAEAAVETLVSDVMSSSFFERGVS